MPYALYVCLQDDDKIAAYAVDAREYLVIDEFRQNHDRARCIVVHPRPAAAIEEGNIEHGEEIGRSDPGGNTEGLYAPVVRCHHLPRPEHHDRVQRNI